MFLNLRHHGRIASLSFVFALVAAMFAVFSVSPARAEESFRVSSIGSSLSGVPIDRTVPWGFKPSLIDVVNWKNKTRIQTYCVERNVGIVPGAELKIADWDSFPGDNQFAKSSQARAKAAWIAAHSFPNISIDQLRTDSAIPDLNPREAVTATQSAIWHFTDGFELDGKLAFERVLKLYDYLVGAANTGATSAKLTISASFNPKVVDGKLGPLRFNSSAPMVKVSEFPLSLMDAAGNEVAADEVPTNQDLFFQLSPGASEGEAEVSATVDGSELVGQLLVPIAAQERHQTLMIVNAKQYETSITVGVKWPAMPLEPKPEPTPSPAFMPSSKNKVPKPRMLPATGSGTLIFDILSKYQLDSYREIF